MSDREIVKELQDAVKNMEGFNPRETDYERELLERAIARIEALERGES